MTAEETIKVLFEKEMDDIPTFSDAMGEHMSEEVDRIKKEAIKWHQEHKIPVKDD